MKYMSAWKLPAGNTVMKLFPYLGASSNMMACSNMRIDQKQTYHVGADLSRNHRREHERKEERL